MVDANVRQWISVPYRRLAEVHRERLRSSHHHSSVEVGKGATPKIIHNFHRLILHDRSLGDLMDLHHLETRGTVSKWPIERALSNKRYRYCTGTGTGKVQVRYRYRYRYSVKDLYESSVL